VLEELHEVDAAQADAGNSAAAPGAVAEELGDLLFAVVNWSRHLGVDAEEALRAANGKFERRFARMEALAAERALALEKLSAAEWDALWCEAKLNAS
jgi:ATP diphosphatase